MPLVNRFAIVPYRPEQMYALVADVERYPSFLPWCRSASCRPAGEDAVIASIEMARGPLRKRFTTRNRLYPPERIHLDLVDGPFRRLTGDWRFIAREPDGCRVELLLEFEFGSRLLEAVVGPLFNEIANSLVDAFCRRAHQQYARAAGR